ncbi:MAG: ribosome-associated translation inhibitor RaiA [Deferribacteres bacterium]|nr:ribosome-associated translation inhibitor RaiA [candidate division KSB1 bacterium]MCB9508879.1 ribosome-associated translation inhibitor RaiA [Deferribacteres bacterium]
MRTSFTARHFKAPAKLKAFAEEEVQRLSKYHDGILECEIVLDFVKQLHKQQTQIAEINISLQGQKLSATEKSEDLRKSITLAVDKLEKQLKKHKTKITKKVKTKPEDFENSLAEEVEA